MEFWVVCELMEDLLKLKLLASSWTLCLGCYLSSQMNFKKTLCVKRNVSAEGLIVKTAKTII